MIEALRQRWSSLRKPAAARRFVAADFDSRQVRLVQAERSGSGVRIVRILGKAAPSGLDLANSRAIGALLQEALKEGHLAGWPLVMCVPRGMAVLKTLAFPPGTGSSELAGMVQYQVDKELPFRAEEAVVDFTTESHFDAGAAPDQAGGTHVLVAAVRVPVVDYYRQIAAAAGCRLLRLGLRPYANQRCFGAAMASAVSERCAVVHITADETEIDVVAGANLAFSRSALGKIPPADSPADEVQAAASGVVAEVVRSLQSYQSVEGGGKVDKVYLAGGTGIEPLVAKELTARLELPCLMFSPAEGMRLVFRGGNASEFISPLGMAAGFVGSPVDFLHPKRPVVVGNPHTKTALLAVAAAVVVVLCTVVARAHYVGAKEARNEKLASDLRQAEARKKGMDANAARVKAIEDWQKKGRNWLDHIAQLSSLFPRADEAYSGAISSLKDGSFKFKLHAASQAAITEIIQNLEKAGYTAKVEGQSKTNDARYPHTADVRITPDANRVVNLEGLVAKPRPEDDMPPGEQVRVRPTPRPSASQFPAPSPSPSPRSSFSPVPSFSPGATPGGYSGGRDPNRRRRFDPSSGRPGQ